MKKSSKNEEILSYIVVDQNYPIGQRYLDKMNCLSGILYKGVLSNYYLMHAIDDIIDDIKLDKKLKSEKANILLEEIKNFVLLGKKNLPKDSLILPKSMYVFARESWQEYGLEKDFFDHYLSLSNYLSSILDWAPNPHFKNLKELENFNRGLFKIVSLICGKIMFNKYASTDQNFYQVCLKELQDLMMAMQLINILMDLNEDTKIKQFFLTLEDVIYDRPQSWNTLTPEILQKYYLVGVNHLNTIKYIFKEEYVGEVSCFLSGLKDIYYTLMNYLSQQFPINLTLS